MLHHHKRATFDLTEFCKVLRTRFVPEHFSRGQFGRCLSGPDRLNFLREFLLDDEHGFVHGLMTAFWALKYDQHFRHDNEWEPMLASCLVHDYARIAGVSTDHDSRLAVYFPKLIPETYSHSAPPGVSPLVVGDRMELLRYTDRSWIDESMLAYPIEGYGEFFFRYVRPAIVQIVRHIDGVWLRHCQEWPELIGAAMAYSVGSGEEVGHEHRRDPRHYPHLYWGTDGDRCPAEFGYLDVRDDEQDRVLWPGKLFPNPGVGKHHVGLLPLSEYHRYDHDVAAMRDHLAVRGEVPLSEWIFFVDQFEFPELLDGCKGFIDWRVGLSLISSVRKIVAALMVFRG